MTTRSFTGFLVLPLLALSLVGQQASTDQVKQLQAALAAQQAQYQAERARMQQQLADMAKALADQKTLQNRAFKTQLDQQVAAEQKLQKALLDADANRYGASLNQLKQLQSIQGAHDDSALYWQAFMQSKLGQDNQALHSLDQLQHQFPLSSWGPDARALDLQVRQHDGQALTLTAARQPNDDLKLLAINGLMQTDPQQALPMLAQVIEGNSSPAVKTRALFVLAQSGTPASLNQLIHVAQQAKDPALSAEATRYIGLYSGPQRTTALNQIFQARHEPEVRRAVVQAYLDGMPEDRASADLSGLPALYPGAADRASSFAIIRVLAQHDQAAALVALARNEKDPELKRAMVAELARMKDKPATDYLLELLKND